MESESYAKLAGLGTLYRGERVFSDAVHFQITKLMEEIGEVANAYIGATGQNLRKGRYSTYHAVATESVDCMITAVVLLSTLMGSDLYDNPLPAEEVGKMVEEYVNARTRQVLKRIADAS